MLLKEAAGGWWQRYQSGLGDTFTAEFGTLSSGSPLCHDAVKQAAIVAISNRARVRVNDLRGLSARVVVDTPSLRPSLALLLALPVALPSFPGCMI
jgi:hypothetical protein